MEPGHLSRAAGPAKGRARRSIRLQPNCAALWLTLVTMFQPTPTFAQMVEGRHLSGEVEGMLLQDVSKLSCKRRPPRGYRRRRGRRTCRARAVAQVGSRLL